VPVTVLGRPDLSGRRRSRRPRAGRTVGKSSGLSGGRCVVPVAVFGRPHLSGWSGSRWPAPVRSARSRVVPVIVLIGPDAAARPRAGRRLGDPDDRGDAANGNEYREQHERQDPGFRRPPLRLLGDFVTALVLQTAAARTGRISGRTHPPKVSTRASRSCAGTRASDAPRRPRPEAARGRSGRTVCRPRSSRARRPRGSTALRGSVCSVRCSAA
jgi:hypothetical protein